MTKGTSNGVAPAKWVKAKKFEEITGYTVDACNTKRARGVWEQGVIWIEAPDGNILYNVYAYEEWAESAAKAA